jgi:hypothetical protein
VIRPFPEPRSRPPPDRSENGPCLGALAYRSRTLGGKILKKVFDSDG